MFGNISTLGCRAALYTYFVLVLLFVWSLILAVAHVPDHRLVCSGLIHLIEMLAVFIPVNNRAEMLFTGRTHLDFPPQRPWVST